MEGEGVAGRGTLASKRARKREWACWTRRSWCAYLKRVGRGRWGCIRWGFERGAVVWRWVVSEVGILMVFVGDGFGGGVGLKDGRLGDMRLKDASVVESGLGAICGRRRFGVNVRFSGAGASDECRSVGVVTAV